MIKQRFPKSSSSDAPGSGRPERAAQFMPFAALTGYYDLVRQKERVVEERRELPEEDALRLSAVLAQARKGQLAEARYYADGAYVNLCGIITEVDLTFRTVTLVKTRIRFDDLYDFRLVD